jgi:pimeloyl-ACP methyl ester carboxylesterase
LTLAMSRLRRGGRHGQRSRSRTQPCTTSWVGVARRCCSSTACAATPTCGPTWPSGLDPFDVRTLRQSRVQPKPPRRHPISTARHADDAAALITGLDLARCVLVGGSSGAVIHRCGVALTAASARRRAQRTTALCLLPDHGRAFLEPGPTGERRHGVEWANRRRDAFFSPVRLAPRCKSTSRCPLR